MGIKTTYLKEHNQKLLKDTSGDILYIFLILNTSHETKPIKLMNN